MRIDTQPARLLPWVVHHEANQKDGCLVDEVRVQVDVAVAGLGSMQREVGQQEARHLHENRNFESPLDSVGEGVLDRLVEAGALGTSDRFGIGGEVVRQAHRQVLRHDTTESR